MHVNRAAKCLLRFIRAVRGGRVDTKRTGVAFEGSRLRGRLTGADEHSEHLQPTQLSRPGQQVGDQQHAQCGDIESSVAPRPVCTQPEQTRAGRADLSV